MVFKGEADSGFFFRRAPPPTFCLHSRSLVFCDGNVVGGRGGSCAAAAGALQRTRLGPDFFFKIVIISFFLFLLRNLNVTSEVEILVVYTLLSMSPTPLPMALFPLVSHVLYPKISPCC